MIEVVDAGRYTSIQDAGRPGLESFGIPPSGATDWFAAAVGNRLVGNRPDAALFEVTAVAPTLRFYRDCTVAITGGGCQVVGGWTGQAGWWAASVSQGSLLNVGPVGPGLRAYIAVRGGLDVPVVLGSRSLCARGTFGGGFGRPLHKGDEIAIGTLTATEPLSKPWPTFHRLPIRGPWEVRVLAGPHIDAFERGALERLSAIACRVTPAVDRMGLRLETPGVRIDAREILTTPVTAGAIQVTPSGELIALLVDHPTTGGYPVIGTVITADLPLLAQARPGDTMRFRPVDLAEATRARRRLLDWLKPDS